MTLDKVDKLILEEAGRPTALDMVALGVAANLENAYSGDAVRASVLKLYDAGYIRAYRSGSKGFSPTDPRATTDPAELQIEATDEGLKVLKASGTC